MKNFAFALALAAFALAGCADDTPDSTTTIVEEPAPVVTEPADDMMMDTTMVDPMMDNGAMDNGTMEGDAMMADSTSM